MSTQSPPFLPRCGPFQRRSSNPSKIGPAGGGRWMSIESALRGGRTQSAGHTPGTTKTFRLSLALMLRLAVCRLRSATSSSTRYRLVSSTGRAYRPPLRLKGTWASNIVRHKRQPKGSTRSPISTGPPRWSLPCRRPHPTPRTATAGCTPLLLAHPYPALALATCQDCLHRDNLIADPQLLGLDPHRQAHQLGEVHDRH